MAVSIHVDQELCMGHGMCAALVPDVFRVDPESGVNLMGETEVGDELAAAARRGAAGCPERAITVATAVAASGAGPRAGAGDEHR